MILYYAVGGGLGHLTRGRRVLQALGLEKNATFVTASPYANDTRVTGGIPTIRIPPHLEHAKAEHRAWLRDLIRERDAERLIADAFPAGIQGELSGLEIPMDHVARILRWDAYRRVVPDELPHFETTWRVEALSPDHEQFLGDMTALTLTLEPLEPAESDDPYWLIVHSGPEEEVRELIAHAAQMKGLTPNPPARILVASRCAVALPHGFEATDIFPAARLFARAGRILSAAGFNVMLETEPWRSKHEVVPFARQFDDQFLRASRRR
jgi:predicted glycosyltransferase